MRWYRKDPIPAAPVPILGGPDLVDPRLIDELGAAANEIETKPASEEPAEEAV